MSPGPIVHGGLNEDELHALGVDPTAVVDLSASLHPAGLDPEVLAATRSAPFHRYPPADAGRLRDALAERAGLDPAMLLVTPGATAALHLVARAFLDDDGVAAIVGPTFGEYRAAVDAAGATAVELRAEPPDFAPPLDAPEFRHATITFLCQPNNPTGTYLDRPTLSRFARECAGLLVIDAAYNDFVAEAWDPDELVRAGERVLVVHSLTKLHAMPGLRVGYTVGSPPLIERLAALLPSWSVDAASLAAGMVAASLRDRRLAALAETWRVRERLRERCCSLGLEVAAGRANFLLVRTGDAAGTRLRLLEHGFLVRDCTSFGLPEWIRIGVPNVRDAPALEAALATLGAESVR